MTINGKRVKKIQTYQCKSGHYFRDNTPDKWEDSFIEHVVYVYLECLSLNVTINIIRATYRENILTKSLVLSFIEQITEAVNKIEAVHVKGTYGDGDKGLIKALKMLLPAVPFQMCVFHKELRMGQIVPAKSVRISKRLTPYQKTDIKVFQLLFRKVI